MRSRKNYHANWRVYQASLKRIAQLKRLKKILTVLAVLVGCVFAGLLFHYFMDLRPTPTSRQTGQKPLPSEKKLNVWPDKLSRKDLSDYLNSLKNQPSGVPDHFIFEKDGFRFKIRTTIEAKLQKYIGRLLRRSRTLQAAVVVLNPYDGRILAMVSRDTDGDGDNLCLKADFPAASLFKIVSAAAALEAAGYTPDQKLVYEGSRHTLYKYQLKESEGPYSAPTTLRKAFATSNNSVFGKIGLYTLGQKVIAEYAEKFFFNKPIPFDLPVAVSRVEVPAHDFGLAEIASGFNKKTLLSPLHAAMLSAMVVNKGGISSPWFISTIADETDTIVYRGGNTVPNYPINRHTAEDLKILMQYAARHGTTRSAFRELRRQKVSGALDLGAKSGTINDRLDRFKYDWITAFALSPDESRGICVGTLTIHGEKLGTRSTELARAIISYYFNF